MSETKLFQPIQIGDIQLNHGVVFAPATRFRADENHKPLPHVAEYYEQRASTAGSLIITEATLIALRAGASKHSPGIWSDEQISAWKEVTDRVHVKGSFIYLQLWTLGRAFYNYSDVAEANIDYVSASDVPYTGGPKPRALTVDEIREFAELYAQAASNAVHKAGFDGVEIHGANGYLLDQFLHHGSNTRTDAYGGSIENRVRFPRSGRRRRERSRTEEDRVPNQSLGNRLGCVSLFLVVRCLTLVTQLRGRYPDLAYLHVVEPRADDPVGIKEGHSNDFVREIWGKKPFISAGGYTRETAIDVAEEKGDLVAFARPYIANPDLPYRLLHDVALAVGDRAMYYVPGSVDPKGFTDYPFAVTA